MKNCVKKVIALILVISTLVIPVASLKAETDTNMKFNDVKTTSWYYSYVTKLADLKITGGYTDGTYKPNNPVTRAEFVTFLCNVKGYKQTKGDPFDDTQKSWATGYITAALANGIIDLPEDKKFRPYDPITRQEVVEMMCKALNITPDEKTKTPYADVSTNPGYSTAAYSNYLMQGSTENKKLLFKPMDKLTRAEAAVIIVNAYDFNADKMAYLNKKIAEENKKKEENEKYSAWQESVKNISSTLLNNKDGLYKGTLYESNKYLKEESDYLKNWGAKYGMKPEEFEKEMVRVGSKYVNLIANANYKKLDAYESTLKELLDFNTLDNYLQKKLDYVKNNTLVSEGNFITSTGMIVYADFGNPVLRGTMKCKYLSPTSTNVLNADTVGSTGKHLQIGTWYEQDFEVRFYAEDKGLKVVRIQPISDIRISK